MIGVCWYPEHWPESWWEEDVRRMRELGIGWVRVGEFAWSRLEPSRGDFRFDWLERALDRLAASGLRAVMCTPTATPPKWLVDERPDILPVDAEGRPRRFGSRRHTDFSSPAWLDETRRICEVVATRFGGHPAVAAWQLDNEYGCHDTVVSWSTHAARAFREWLEARYGGIAALNEAWGNVFWSMEYRSFGEIDPPQLTVTEPNPAHRLDWLRFSSTQVARYNRLQAEIVRAHGPGRPLTHNFMGFFTAFAHAEVAADLDFASWDSYPLGFTDQRMPWLGAEERRRWARTGHPDAAAFHHDLYRGIARDGRFWVMEQQPGPVNWAAHNPAPAPGMVRLWALEAYAHGAQVVSFFRWRQAPFAQEQMHAGLERPDRTLAPGGEDVRRLAAELPALGLGGQRTRRAPVALVFDEEAHWCIDIQRQGASFDWMELCFAFYGAVRRLGLDVDVARPGDPLAGYELVLVPGLPIVTRAAAAAFAAADGTVVFGPRSGSRTESHRIPDNLPPGPLQEFVDVRVSRVESLPPPVVDTAAWRGGRVGVGRWREHLAGTAEPVVTCADGSAAAVRQGRYVYLGFWPGPDFLGPFLAELAREAGLPVRRLPDGLRLRRRGDLTLAFNRDEEARDLPAPASAVLRLGTRPLAPFDVAVW